LQTDGKKYHASLLRARRKAQRKRRGKVIEVNLRGKIAKVNQKGTASKMNNVARKLFASFKRGKVKGKKKKLPLYHWVAPSTLCEKCEKAQGEQEET